MSLEKATVILRDCELDRMTKLNIINLITMSSDEAMVNDLINLIIEWDAADNEAESEFLTKMKEIEAKYDQEIAAEDQKAEDALGQVKEDVESSEKAQELKKGIASVE